MSKHLPLATSQKLVKLIGEFETENFHTWDWCEETWESWYAWVFGKEVPEFHRICPAPDFWELILLAHKISQKTQPIKLSINWIWYTEYGFIHKLSRAYIDSSGDMSAVAKILEEIIS